MVYSVSIEHLRMSYSVLIRAKQIGSAQLLFTSDNIMDI